VRSLPDEAPPDAGGGAARAPRGCTHTGSGAAASSGAAGLPGGATPSDAASPPASATAGRPTLSCCEGRASAQPRGRRGACQHVPQVCLTACAAMLETVVPFA